MKVCNIINCKTIVYAKQMCSRHYRQILHFGKIKRTKFDPNEIFIKNNECKMYLYNNEGEIIASTFFDLEFLEEVKKYKWYRQKAPHTHYVLTNINQNKKERLHGLILPCEEPYEVDHKDHDGLNNRLENLRIVTRLGNAENQKNNVSGYPGVCWHKRDQIWFSYIQVNYKRVSLGYFATAEEAHKVREKFKKEHNIK